MAVFVISTEVLGLNLGQDTVLIEVFNGFIAPTSWARCQDNTMN